MIQFHQGKLSKKDEQRVKGLLVDYSDIHGDFYITKDNLRLFIKENGHLLVEAVNKGDKITWGQGHGIAFATGFAEKANRYYVKLLTDNEDSAYMLLKVLTGRIKGRDLWAKLKKNNPYIKTFNRCGFKFYASRGKEILLQKKYIDYEAMEKEIESGTVEGE